MSFKQGTTIQMEDYLNNSGFSLGNLKTVAGGLLGVWAAYCIGLVVYRLYIDPLSSIPGPKIAAATGWYEFYYDVIKRGQYIYRIEEMHKQYGKCSIRRCQEIVKSKQ